MSAADDRRSLESAFRDVLGHLPTGVTVVTALGDDGPVGMAANSVTSLSLEPPLVLFCPAKSSTTWPSIRATGSFCINVMASHHEPAVRRFALRGADRFAGVAWAPRPSGPALDDALAVIECTLDAEHDGGDHTIAIGAVTALEARQRTLPLIFFQGRYGRFAEHD